MNHFNAYYRQVRYPGESGKTKDDYRREALQLYFDIEDVEFKWPHCIDVLWESPQFDPMNPEYDSGNEGSPPGNDDALTAAASNDDGTGDISAAKPPINSVERSIQGGTLVRPMGNKAAKKLAADAD